MALRQPNWMRLLTILLVILALMALLYISFAILQHFTHTILLFVMGALLAYVMSPLVNRLTDAFHFRWFAIVLSYSFVAVLLFSLGVLLFTPFIEQSQSLVNNLHNPTASSLRHIAILRGETQAIERLLARQRAEVNHHKQASTTSILAMGAAIAAFRSDLVNLQANTLKPPTDKHGGGPLAGRSVPNPRPSMTVPPSYVTVIAARAEVLFTSYDELESEARTSGIIDASLVRTAYSMAHRTRLAAEAMYATMSTTPILLLRAQTWLDEHHVRVDLANRFGDVAHQLSAQGTNLLNNAITILSETANILLDITLVLIISFYMLSDGGDIVHRGLNLIPSAGREQAWFFVSSLDRVLGGYIRGQLFLSLLAGLLGGGGAQALGVPYPLLIGIMTALLEAVPVIGPMVAAVPAVAVALFFTPLATAVILLIWFVVFQQIVTNVLGPRIMGMAVGIHPLEAMLAVLIGYPLGGFLGAFLAVPVAGIVHILIREAYAYFVLGHALPSAVLPVQPEPSDQEIIAPRPVVKRTGTDSAPSR